MRARRSFFLSLFLFCLVSSLAFGQINIEREVLVKLSPELTYGLLGMRYSAGKVVMMNNLGRMLSYNLETGEAFNGRIKGERLIDFDLILGQPVYLTEEGKLKGQVMENWPDKQFAACRVEACDQGVLLLGGDKLHFLANNATRSVDVESISFALPVADGFVWSLGKAKKMGSWSISLIDCYGNLMKEVYRFASEFDPCGIELGPVGEEGEALISCYENNYRKLATIGQNGHMFWKINGPEKICPRDLAFDGEGNLLVIEKFENGAVLSRWKFALPQG